MRKLTHPELLERQKDRDASCRLPFTAVLNNIRSLHNVGSIFRTADGVGIEKLWLCGITGIPPDNKISKTALGAEKVLPWEYCRHARECILMLKSQGYSVVMLEQAHGSIPYQRFPAPSPVCLVIGNEISGIDDSLMDLCDSSIEIEMAGLKNSLNVSVAFGIAAYHFRNSILDRIAL